MIKEVTSYRHSPLDERDSTGEIIPDVYTVVFECTEGKGQVKEYILMLSDNNTKEELAENLHAFANAVQYGIPSELH